MKNKQIDKPQIQLGLEASKMTRACPNISQMQVEQHSQVKKELWRQLQPGELRTRSRTKGGEEQ